MAKLAPIVVDLELSTDLKGAIAAEVSKQLAERDRKLASGFRAMNADLGRRLTRIDDQR